MAKINDAITFTPCTSYPNGLTTLYHVRKTVNEINGKEVLNSNIYYDSKNKENYLDGEIIKELHAQLPLEYSFLVTRMWDLKITAHGKLPSMVITREGVKRLLYVYKIDPETLLVGGPKIPMKQSGLFGSDKVKDGAYRADSRANVYIGDLPNRKGPLIGLNLFLSGYITQHFPSVNQVFEGKLKRSLFAKVSVTAIPMQPGVQIKIKFQREGSFDAYGVSTGAADTDGFRNLKILANSRYESLRETLQTASLSHAKSPDIMIHEENETLTIKFPTGDTLTND